MLEWMLVPALAALTLGAVFVGGGGTPDDDELTHDDADLDEADLDAADLDAADGDLLDAVPQDTRGDHWLWPEAGQVAASAAGDTLPQGQAETGTGSDDFVVYLGDAASDDPITLADFKPGVDSLHVLYDAAPAPGAAGPASLADAITVETTPEGAMQILGDGDLLVEIKDAASLRVGLAEQGAQGPVTTLGGEAQPADSFDVIISRAPATEA